MDLEELIKQDLSMLGANIGQGLNLLDSMFLSRELSALDRYKQIRNMDFSNNKIVQVIEYDVLLIYNKHDGFYYTMSIDSKSVSLEEQYFNASKS